MSAKNSHTITNFCIDDKSNNSINTKGKLTELSTYSSANNTWALSPTVVNGPLSEDFTAGVPPAGWVVVNPDSPAEGWELTTTTGSDGTANNEAARMDNYQYNSPGQLDYLVMPAIDLSRVTNPMLHFDVAYAAFGPNNFERLHIEYSTDCGDSFVTTTYDKGYDELPTVGNQGNGWGPQAAADWRAETVDLTPYKSAQTIFQFVQTNGYGNGLFIDNVRIETVDPPVADFSNPLVACSGSTVTFTDLSMEFPTAWTWSFSPNTVTYENGTDANSISPQVSFNASGTYEVSLTVTSVNGTHTKTSYIAIVDSSTGPLSEDFTMGVPPTGWAVLNPDSPSEGWELTTTTGSDGTANNEAARMDNYQYNSPGQLDYLVMTAIDLSRVTNPMLHFDVAYAAFGPNNFERLHIEYSTDCGTNFVTTSYSKQNLDLATVDYQGNGWGPSDASHWRAETVDLTPYKSAQTIFQFVQTNGYGNGLFIDNIRIETVDPPVADFSNPLVACSGSAVTFTDLSMEFPTAWTWSFSPNTVTYENGTDANSISPQVSFNASGTYEVSLTVTSVNGTHTKTSNIAIVGSNTGPLSEDFTIGVPPTGWAVVNPDSPAEGWELTTTTGSDGTANNEAARMDNYQYNSPGQLDYLVMPSIDIQSNVTNPVLHFDVAYAAFGPNNFERLHIEYSTDCGTNFASTSYSKQNLDLATVDYQGNGWGPSDASHWRAETVDLTPYKSTQTILQFVQTCGYGNGLFIDNIRIEAADAPVANFSASTTTACVDELITLTDLSTELPAAWTWTFSPNTVTFQNGTTANSQHPQVSFDAAGDYTVTLVAANSVGSTQHSAMTTINLDDASFAYTNAAYCQDESNPSPTISGLSGGTFSSAPAGLELTAATGAVNLANSTAGTYTVTYTTNGTCPNTTNQNITINALDDASFAYANAAYCQDESNPSPTISGLTGGTFESEPAGLAITSMTGEIDLAASSLGTYTVTYTTNGACPTTANQSLTVNDANLPPCAVLAVEWLNFSGHTTKAQQVQLDWKIAQQLQLSHFVVEHSHDGISFIKLGTVAAQSTQAVYQFIHEQPRVGVNYYRLQEVELSGAYTYSKTIQVSLETKEQAILVYPNPVHDKVILDLIDIQNEDLEIQLFDQLGKRVLQQRVEFVSQTQLDLNLSTLTKGVYFLQLKYGEQTEVKRLIKQ